MCVFLIPANEKKNSLINLILLALHFLYKKKKGRRNRKKVTIFHIAQQ